MKRILSVSRRLSDPASRAVQAAWSASNYYDISDKKSLNKAYFEILKGQFEIIVPPDKPSIEKFIGDIKLKDVRAMKRGADKERLLKSYESYRAALSRYKVIIKYLEDVRKVLKNKSTSKAKALVDGLSSLKDNNHMFERYDVCASWDIFWSIRQMFLYEEIPLEESYENMSSM